MFILSNFRWHRKIYRHVTPCEYCLKKYNSSISYCQCCSVEDSDPSSSRFQEDLQMVVEQACIPFLMELGELLFILDLRGTSLLAWLYARFYSPLQISFKFQVSILGYLFLAMETLSLKSAGSNLVSEYISGM